MSATVETGSENHHLTHAVSNRGPSHFVDETRPRDRRRAGPWSAAIGVTDEQSANRGKARSADDAGQISRQKRHRERIPKMRARRNRLDRAVRRDVRCRPTRRHGVEAITVAALPARAPFSGYFATFMMVSSSAFVQ